MIVAMPVSDELNVHVAGEFEVGAITVNVLGVVGDWLYVTSLNSPIEVVAPRIVKVIVNVDDPWPPKAAWFAVIVVVPIFFGVKTLPTKVATVESAIVNVHEPDEFEVGSVKFKFETLSFAIVILVKVPSIFGKLVTVKVVLTSPPNQFVVADCVAVIVVVPASKNVSVSPDTVAILESAVL